jgi:predicted phosphodiesterase
MATYAISDIHGAYDEFQKLLKKTGIRYDGSDVLYLLGDYIDWGTKSLETLQLVKRMDEQYDFVHCTLGNHELMFLQTLDSGYDGVHINDVAANWLYGNKGYLTWNAFLALPDREQEEIVEWLRSLRLSYTAQVGGLSFMLAHAYPYYYDCEYSPAERKRRRQDAVWRRLLIRENPFSGYAGMQHYDYLICGHTISDSYYQELRFEDGRPYRRMREAIRNRIFRGDTFIDIDCGAKCMELDPTVSEVTQLASMRAQLAALRLDDMEGFYVHHAGMLPDIDDMANAASDMRRHLVSAAEDAANSLTAATENLSANLPHFRMPELLRLPEDMKMPEFPELRKFLGGQQSLYDFARGIPHESGNVDTMDGTPDGNKRDLHDPESPSGHTADIEDYSDYSDS